LYIEGQSTATTAQPKPTEQPIQPALEKLLQLMAEAISVLEKITEDRGELRYVVYF